MDRTAHATRPRAAAGIEPRARRRHRPAIIALALLVGAAGCEGGAGVPDPASPEYGEAVSAFYRGLAAAQVGESGVADASFQRVTELAPEEPSGWANWAVVALQRGQPELAAERIARAEALAPGDPRIGLASAVVARERGALDVAAGELREAGRQDSVELRSLYLLARILEQEGRPEGLTEARTLIDRILARRPDNLAALLERARLAARAADGAAVDAALNALDGRAAELTPEAVERLDAARGATRGGAFGEVGREIAFLQTELQPLEAYRRDLDALTLDPGRTDLLLERLLRLQTPSFAPAPADTGLVYTPEPLDVGAGPTAWVRAVWIDELAPLAMVAAKGGTLWIGTDPQTADTFALPAPGDAPLPPSALAPLDYDYDFRTDLLIAGPGGARLLRQTDDGFVDATTAALPAGVTRGAWTGAWAADLDMEGDLDLVLARADGPPALLRNLGDGTFALDAAFEEVAGLRDFEWADLDADGDPDAALLDGAGRLTVFENRRHDEPRFVPYRAGPIEGVRAIAAAELTGDATFDLVLLDSGRRVRALSLRDGDWRERTLATREGAAGSDTAGIALFVHDMDNNGELDLLVSSAAGARIWLSGADGFRPLPPLDVRVTDVADVSGEGRLDLVGVSGDGTAQWLASGGARDYFAVSLRPRAATATGDRRINPFGIGGEIEVRAGLLYQKRLIQAPVVHVGLGEHAQVDVARIIWPNGSVQAEFNLAAGNEAALTRQRLKGSCPWVFAFDGERMGFVTDFLWRTALGLRINAQGGAAVLHSEDWVLIRGDQLAPREGVYDVRITAELWETHFFDHVSLMVVDHPVGTDVLVDERFTLPAPEPAVQPVGPLRSMAGARDQRGRDVAELVAAVDGVYLDTFERGPYQGLAEDHWVEVDLGEPDTGTGEAPAGRPLWLVASGWIYPTDSSINLAIAQGGDHRAPRGLRLEVPDGAGGWVVAEPDLGFPAGKTKTILVDLSGVFRPGTERKLRLRTTMEIYWDRIAWTVGRPEAELRTQQLLPETAELRYRGFSEVSQPSRTSPELPDYARIAGTAPRWRDLVGYHTRFGDVRPLSESVDDRYVIMNAGDELVLRFPAPPPPPDGWTRDFVLIGDGWVKDGDYNTGFSTTVRPLPYHGMAGYDVAPGRLEEDPGYRRHPEDWQLFHTRYVTPQEFHDALVPARDD